MNTSEIKRFKIMLESRLAALWGRARNRNTIAIENTADTMDEVRLAEERDLAIQILGRDFAELRLVEAARSSHRGWIVRLLSPMRGTDQVESSARHAACRVLRRLPGSGRAAWNERVQPPEAATSTARLAPSKSTIRSTPGRPPRLAGPVRRNRTRTVAA